MACAAQVAHTALTVGTQAHMGCRIARATESVTARGGLDEDDGDAAVHFFWMTQREHPISASFVLSSTHHAPANEA